MMNLAATLNWLKAGNDEASYGLQPKDELLAGGEGSGCHGPKCGRPKGSGSREDKEFIPHSGKKYEPKQEETSGKTFKGPKAKSVPPDLGDVGNIKIGSKKPSAASKAFEVYKEKQEKAPLPVPAPTAKPVKSNIEEGDKVLLTKPVEGWNEKTWDKQTFQVGGKCHVVAPGVFEVGGQQFVRIKLPKFGETKDVPLDSVMLYQKGKINAPTVLTEPPKKALTIKQQEETLIIPKAPKQSVEQSYFVKTGGTNKKPEGYQYTVLKPSNAPGEKGEGPNKPHYLKGQFKEISKNVPNVNDPKTLTSVYQAMSKGTGGAQAVNVFIHRHIDTKTATIREVKQGEHGHTFGTVRQYKFNSLNAAGKWLNMKYGLNFGQFVSTKLPKKKGP